MKKLNMMLTYLLATTIYSARVFAADISIMNYNIFNSFDSRHDEGKKDFEFLPLEQKKGKYAAETQEFCTAPGASKDCFEKDWTPTVYAAHIKSITAVLRQYDGGKGPDIAVFEEIENIKVLKDIIQELSKEKYKYYSLIENTDQRGIDVGVISKIPIKSAFLHNPGDEYEGVHRGIIQVDLQVNNKVVTVLGNHWPSPRSANSSDARLNASKHFRKIANSIKSDFVIGVGDFNTSDGENAEAIDSQPASNAIHALYDEFIDVKPYVDSHGGTTFPGSYYFKNKWEVLDRFLIRKKDVSRKSSAVKPIYDSFQIIHYDFLFDLSLPPSDKPSRDKLLSNRSESPIRFDWKTKQGYSDHLPVVMKLSIDN